MSVHKNEDNGTWYVMARYNNWKGEHKQKCKRGFPTKREAQEWERRVKEKHFSVQSLRLDAVVAGLFDLSRTEAARQIEAGNVSVNYRECLKCDLAIREGDVLSLRGKGKGSVTGLGGSSRKGRLFVLGEVLQ